jgi:hypothetical protein
MSDAVFCSVLALVPFTRPATLCRDVTRPLRIKSRKSEIALLQIGQISLTEEKWGNWMKLTIYALTAVSLAWLMLRMAPDVRRYLRMRAM